MKCRTLVMLASLLIFAGTVGAAHLFAQHGIDHPDHDRGSRASRVAPAHKAQSHDRFDHASSAHDKSLQDTMDRNLRNAREVSERKAQEKEHEQMRQKDHDNRVKVSEHTSVGVRVEPGGASVNIKTDMDRPRPGDHRR